jgi:hypothetical protein
MASEDGQLELLETRVVATDVAGSAKTATVSATASLLIS